VNLEVFVFAPSNGCPATTNLLSLDASFAIPTCVLLFEVSGLRRRTPVRPVPAGQTGLMLLHLRLQSSVLASWINQGTQWFSGEPPETPRTQCSLRQSPLMTWLPRSPGSSLVLRLNEETAHDFILLFLPPCGSHLTLLATGSLEPSLLEFSTPGGLTTPTFRACSSPASAPTSVKPQPAPAILSQESVHTTLSITHLTRKRPSTGSRTTHGSQSPP
jgi:hypothetical protein